MPASLAEVSWTESAGFDLDDIGKKSILIRKTKNKHLKEYIMGKGQPRHKFYFPIQKVT